MEANVHISKFQNSQVVQDVAKYIIDSFRQLIKTRFENEKKIHENQKYGVDVTFWQTIQIRSEGITFGNERVYFIGDLHMQLLNSREERSAMAKAVGGIISKEFDSMIIEYLEASECVTISCKIQNPYNYELKSW